MKKGLSTLCIAALVLSLTACSTAQTADTPSQKNTGQDVLSGEIRGEITVSAYETFRYKNFLEEAAKAFEQKYPGTKVNISTFSKMPEVKTSGDDDKKMTIMTKGDDSQARVDYINKINTELMSGRGADVLGIDVLPWYKYAQSGQLEDVSKYMDTDPAFNLSDYRGNILQATRYKDGQYIFPLDYTFNYFAYDSSLFTEEQQKQLQMDDTFTYENLIGIGASTYKEVSRNTEKPIKMFGFDERDIFRKLLQENYKDLIDIEQRKVHINGGKFAKLLESVKEYAEKDYLKPSTATGTQITLDSLQKNKDEQYFYKVKNNFSLLQHFNKNSRKMAMMDSGQSSSGNEDNDKIAGLSANSDGKVSFSYNQAYAINSNSANKRTAWEFIKFLASEEMQTSLQLSLNGLPINNNARSEKAKLSVTGELYSAMMSPQENTGGGELTDEQMEIYNKYIKTVDRFSDLINSFPVTDTTIESMINAEIENFFNGSKTADEVADILQSKIELYLSE
ncbi:ABC transporter substrate-binding protein [Brevibacillus borstelensis]|uniref:ABC transporter substrate-binding protein n=1 Tax=Brevibacillus borstelensis TaxID=45462 RepID=UPI0030C505F8